jgi:hypothetical protein
MGIIVLHFFHSWLSFLTVHVLRIGRKEFMDTQTLLNDSHDDSLKSENRRAVLAESGLGYRRWFMNPRFWALAIGIFVLVVGIVLIVVLVTVSKNGHNIKQVKSIIEASQTASLGYTRLGYVELSLYLGR